MSKRYEWIAELGPAEYRAFLAEDFAAYREAEERKEERRRELAELEMEAEERGGRHWPL